jgi:ribosomal protein S6--L-glutamate ligase
MIIGILSARDSRYHPNRRLIEAASELNHDVVLVHPEKCRSGICSDEFDLESTAFEQLEVILPRVGATIKEYTLALVRHFELVGIAVVNGFQSIVLARHKFLSLQTLARHSIPVPDSYFVSNLEDFERVVAKLGDYPVVAKRHDSRQGEGVSLVESRAAAAALLDNLPRCGYGLLVQEYIPAPQRRDVRALVLRGQVVAAMELHPKVGDFRSNIHLGGRARALSLPQDLQTLASESAQALGLEIGGVDIIVDGDDTAKVIEVNYSPGFEGLERATGLDIAAEIIHCVARTGRWAP